MRIETTRLKVLALLLADAIISGATLKSLREPRLRERLRVDRRVRHGFAYSIYRAESSERNPDLLYYFHGAGQNDKSWPHWGFARDFYAAYRRQGVPPPAVVSVSFGHLWLLTDEGPFNGNGLLRRFIEEAMPAVESETGAPRYRFGWGMSMGGFNLLELLFRRPELWRAAALSSPAIPTLGPLSAEPELVDYLRRTRAGRLRVRWMIDFVKPHFRTAEDWLRHDPLALALEAQDLPPILIECGDRDEWGFFEGSERLHEALLEAGAPVTLRLRAGGVHCDIDADSVAAFFRTYAVARGWRERMTRAARRARGGLRRAASRARRLVAISAGQRDRPSIAAAGPRRYNHAGNSIQR